MEIPSNLLPVKVSGPVPLCRELSPEFSDELNKLDPELCQSIIKLLSKGEHGIIADLEGKCYLIPLTADAVIPAFVRRNI